jgi:hypothetical protein
MNHNQVINDLINLFTTRIITGKDGEVLYQTIKLINQLQDENVVLKGRIDGHSCLQGNH